MAAMELPQMTEVLKLHQSMEIIKLESPTMTLKYFVSGMTAHLS
jgi:hypothetical protein